jgi:hypothetical protein
MRALSCALLVSLTIHVLGNSAFSDIHQFQSQSDLPSSASSAAIKITPGSDASDETLSQLAQQARVYTQSKTARPLEAAYPDVAKRDALRRTLQGTLPPAIGVEMSDIDGDYDVDQYYDGTFAATGRVSHGGVKVASDFVSKAAAQAAGVGRTDKPSAVRAHNTAAETVGSAASQYHKKTRVHTSETSRDGDFTQTVSALHSHMKALQHEERSAAFRAAEEAAVAAVSKQAQPLTTVEPTVIGTEVRETANHGTAEHETEQQLAAVQEAATAAVAAAAAQQEAAQQSAQTQPVEADLTTNFETADSVTAAAVRTIVYSGIALAVPVVATVALSTGTAAATAAALSTSTVSTATATAATAGVMLLHQLQFATLTGLIKADQSQDVSIDCKHTLLFRYMKLCYSGTLSYILHDT